MLWHGGLAPGHENQNAAKMHDYVCLLMSESLLGPELSGMAWFVGLTVLAQIPPTCIFIVMCAR